MSGILSKKERPILFSAPMVRALLDGSKTQTRRLMKDLPPWPITEVAHSGNLFMPNGPSPSGRGMSAGHWRPCPYGQPGDRLWLREAWSTHACFDGVAPAALTTRSIHYLADGQIETGKGRPSIHMPRWASRILLEIVSVRVERLQDISEADAKAEGCGQIGVETGKFDAGDNPIEIGSYTLAYHDLWESINGAGSWDANPWVWVVEFKRVASC